MQNRTLFLLALVALLAAAPSAAVEEGGPIPFKQFVKHLRSWDDPDSLARRRLILSGPLILEAWDDGITVEVKEGKESIALSLSAFSRDRQLQLLESCGPLAPKDPPCRAVGLVLTLNEPWDRLLERDSPRLNARDVAVAWESAPLPRYELPLPFLDFLLRGERFLGRDITLTPDRLELGGIRKLALAIGPYRIDLPIGDADLAVFQEMAERCYRVKAAGCRPRAVRFRLLEIPNRQNYFQFAIERLSIDWQEPWSPPPLADRGSGPRLVDALDIYTSGQALIGQVLQLPAGRVRLSADHSILLDTEDAPQMSLVPLANLEPQDHLRILRHCTPEHADRFDPSYCDYGRVAVLPQTVFVTGFAVLSAKFLWSKEAPPLGEANGLPLVDYFALAVDPHPYLTRRVHLEIPLVGKVPFEEIGRAGFKDGASFLNAFSFDLSKLPEEDLRRLETCEILFDRCQAEWIEAEVVTIGKGHFAFRHEVHLGGEIRIGWRTP